MDAFHWCFSTSTWNPLHPGQEPDGPLQRVESWLNRGVAPRAYPLHVARFGEAPDGLWPAAIELLTHMYEGTPNFPRIARFGDDFYLHIRPAPPLREHTVLTWLDPIYVPDPRTQPLVKGPDLAALAEFRTKYLLPGTDDVIIGDFAETTTGALVGWDDETLVLPKAVHLPSTTQQLVARRAESLGIRVKEARLHPDQPLWFLNAVQGISPVSAVYREDGSVVRVPSQPDTGSWREWWSS